MHFNKKKTIQRQFYKFKMLWRKYPRIKEIIEMMNWLNCKNWNWIVSRQRYWWKMDNMKKPIKSIWKMFTEYPQPIPTTVQLTQLIHLIQITTMNSICLHFGEIGWLCASKLMKRQRNSPGLNQPLLFSLMLCDINNEKLDCFCLPFSK